MKADVSPVLEDEFRFADLDLNDDWDPVQGNDSLRHLDRSAYFCIQYGVKFIQVQNMHEGYVTMTCVLANLTCNFERSYSCLMLTGWRSV